MNTKKASPLTGTLILGGFVAVALIVLFAVRSKLQAQDHGAHAGHTSWAATHAPTHAVVKTADEPRTLLTAFDSAPRPGAKVRTLRQFYSRRAYPGAPPVIAHDVQFDGVINDDCLSCHQDGGHVPELNAYTPVTPHPQMENCRQCHVAQMVDGTFVKTE